MASANCNPAEIARLVEELADSPRLFRLATELLVAALKADSGPVFLQQALFTIAGWFEARFAAVLESREGSWQTISQVSPATVVPVELVAKVADTETVCWHDAWCGVPIPGRSAATVLCVGWQKARPESRQELSQQLHLIGRLVGWLWGYCQDNHRLKRRVFQLERLLQLVRQWHAGVALEPLLIEMAEAAAEMLEADRASIFLWDRKTRRLVARPALGVPDGRLEVPDDRGVVGQVLKTGQPCRADARHNSQLIDHTVDAQLGYRTESVLCVPLKDRQGKLLGAFEVLNARDGRFTAEDEQLLLLLAEQAATALENVQDREQLLATSRQLVEQAAAGVQLVGCSAAIEAIRSTVRQVADTDLAVLILGENGTGKEVVARMIHYLSGRRNKPFVAVNCAAIPESLAESELFGYEKGAFTDARESKPGKFELAADGTLFLDEIAELSPACQAKLLRVLEEKVIVRVGGTRPIVCEARILAATNQPLLQLVEKGKFREDLFYRLNVVTIEIPPLRSRPEDIVPLAEHFLRLFSQQAGRPVPQLSAAAKKRLMQHNWPGNVRELRNLMERIAYLVRENVIRPEHLQFVTAGRAVPFSEDEILPLAQATRRFQCEYIRRVIDGCNGNITQAAERLGLHRANLYRKMRQLGMIGKQTSRQVSHKRQGGKS